MKKVHGWEGVKKERMETVEDDMDGYESEQTALANITQQAKLRKRLVTFAQEHSKARADCPTT